MRILSIETSCDETSLALVEQKRENFSVKKHVIATQIKTHAKYGGVVPEVAARKHMETMFPLIKKVVPRQGRGIDLIAATYGPGLVTALRVGVETAKTLAWLWDKPLVGVNHLAGHIYANWLGAGEPPQFPVLSLIVSGGHTELVLSKKHGDFEFIGGTRDDAAGEAFDKVAKLLELGYPGGPAISKLAEKGEPQAIDFPRPMINTKDFDFSFSGLKTAVLYEIKKAGKKRTSRMFKANVAASFQEAAVDVWVTKTLRAIGRYKPKTVLLAGGVSANTVLRKRLAREIKKEFPKIRFVKPALKYTTDNAAMIAVAGYFAFKQKGAIDPFKLKAEPNLSLK